MDNNYKYSNQAYINELLKHDEDYHNAALNFIKSGISHDAKILDYGCGTGNLVRILNEMGYSNVIGVDIDIDTIKMGRSGNKIENIYTLDEFNLSNNNFDFVVSHHVIEHVEDVYSFLMTLSDLVKVNGVLLIVTPNYLNPKGYLSYIKSRVTNKELHLKPFNNGNLLWLCYMFIKSLIMTISKLVFKNNYILKVTPIDPNISYGGDADATWMSNYLDISIFLKSYSFQELQDVNLLKKISNDMYIGKKCK